MKRFGYSRSERLRKRREYLAVSRGARQRVKTGNFLILIMANGLAQSRLGITVTKKIGHAVVRNRIKRQVREFFRHNKQRLSPGNDVVVIARQGAAGLNQQQVNDQLLVLIDRPKNIISG